MNLISLQKVSFADFIKTCMTISLLAGITFGLVLLILSILGPAKATVTTDSAEIAGLAGVLISNMAVIVISLGLGLMTGLVAYLPFVKLLGLLPKSES